MRVRDGIEMRQGGAYQVGQLESVLEVSDQTAHALRCSVVTSIIGTIG